MANITALLKFLDRQSKTTLWFAAFLATVALGLVDYLTGFEISFAFFYLLPVSLAAWAISRNAGFVLSLASAATWLIANLLAGEQYSRSLILYWNGVMRAGFFFVVAHLLAELHRFLEQERSLATIDFLTGALNRRAFYDVAAAEIARASRYQHAFTVVYIDLDNFKAVNDHLGHTTGDGLLKTVVDTIAYNTRAIDQRARLGGDEFAVLLPETDHESARAIVSRLHQALLDKMEHNRWPVTFSIGVLTCRKSPVNVEEMIGLADQLMYGVKTTSKNAVSYSIHGDQQAVQPAITAVTGKIG